MQRRSSHPEAERQRDAQDGEYARCWAGRSGLCRTKGRGGQERHCGAGKKQPARQERGTPIVDFPGAPGREVPVGP